PGAGSFEPLDPVAFADDSSRMIDHLPGLPSPRASTYSRSSISQSNVLLARTQKEMEGVVGGKEERSIIGLLIKGGSDDSQFCLSTEEIMAQIKLLLLAGYETTAISLTWALLELSRNVDVQTKLRRELLEHVPDPTYDQLSNGLPYLDAVVHEILRIHPPAVEVTRI
ncbi:cytochrome P450, partial [Boletus edulis]